MLELPPNTKKGFLYLVADDALDKLRDYVCLRSLYTEAHGNVKVMAVEVSEGALEWSGSQEAGQTLPDSFRCLHGIKIAHRSLNRLPQEGWEELIDCWSCHNCEFRTMLGLTPRPRDGGLLLSDLFLLANDSDLPACCQRKDLSVRKLFYNEVVPSGWSHEMLVYLYLDSYFQNNSALLLEVDGEKYEVRCFYKAMLAVVEDKALRKRPAIKVGIKRTDRLSETTGSINEFYIRLIHRVVMSGTVGISILGYAVSFVQEQQVVQGC